MHEHHLIAKEYGLHPAVTWGVDPFADPLMAYQLMRATFYAGRSVDARLRQTTRVMERDQETPPKGYHWTERPIWDYEQAVGLTEPPPEADDLASDEAIHERARHIQREVTPETVSLLRGLAAANGHDHG